MTKEQKKAKKSILQIILERLKEKPATEQEIAQLRLEVEKYRLKAEIAKSKDEIKKAKQDKFSFGSTRQTKSYSDTEEDISRILRGAVKTKDVDFFSSDSKPDTFSKQDQAQSDKEKEAYRKRVLGL